ncbi:MAG: RIP metalloprotease RseP [candidate division WOR-3 bacterium]
MLLITALAFLFVLGFSITIHEFGHFLFAKIFRIPVEKFSIGFGPPIIKKKIGETDFRIAYLPVGGYVKLAGEEDAEIPLHKPSAPEWDSLFPGFYEAPLFHRFMVVLSGPVFNIFSGALVLVILYAIFGNYVNAYLRVKVEKGGYAERAGFMDMDSLIAVDGKLLYSWEDLEKALALKKDSLIMVTLKRNDEILTLPIKNNPDSLILSPVVPPVVGSLKIGGPADKAGIKTNDTILYINNKRIATWDEFVNIVRASRNIPLEIVWKHQQETKTAVVTPISYYDPILQDTVGQIGIVMPLKKVRVPLVRAVTMATLRTVDLIYLTLKTFYQLIKGEISRKALGGPVAIAKLTGESVRWGFENLLSLLSVISINLGLVNLFPIPALDGGHIIIVFIEAIRRKRFSRKTRLIIQQIGFAIIFMLIIFVTFNDLTR